MKFKPTLLTMLMALSAHAAEQRAPAPAMPARAAPPTSANLPAVQAPAGVMRPPLGQVNAPPTPATGMQLGNVPLKCDQATGKKQPASGGNPTANKLGWGNQTQHVTTYSVTNILGQAIPAGRTIEINHFADAYGQTFTHKLGAPLMPGQNIKVGESPTMPGPGNLGLPSCQALLLP